MLVAVCAGENCGQRADDALDALRPVVRSTPGAVLLSMACWRKACAANAHDPEVTYIAVRRWRPRAGEEHPRQFRAKDAEQCAVRVVGLLRQYSVSPGS
ncbi:hypothetical protein D9V41_07400 [Aeromicrobium phragmitis]|uniref:Uncharacterized protein n=1 Tax=Aeromicrobium phragmitis TaxID=2478914 RepID=A0A3L8PP78_9ACTN|nr:hypothetical protein D9V41_07400 [Aeromicrobium phragmitis]